MIKIHYDDGLIISLLYKFYFYRLVVSAAYKAVALNDQARCNGNHLLALIPAVNDRVAA